jgi:Glycosyltransferase
MDVFCLSSLSEGTSMTLLEAGIWSLPSVVTNVGGNGEVVINGETGFVVDSGDTNEMAAALKKLYMDKEMRRKMGKAAFLRVKEHYCLEKMVSSYEAVYHAVKR